MTPPLNTAFRAAKPAKMVVLLPEQFEKTRSKPSLNQIWPRAWPYVSVPSKRTARQYDMARSSAMATTQPHRAFNNENMRYLSHLHGDMNRWNLSYWTKSTRR